MQLVFEEELKEYFEFDETRHVIKLIKIPNDGFLDEYNSGGVLDVRKIFTRFLELIHKSVANLSENKSKMDSFGLAAMTVDWEPCRGNFFNLHFLDIFFETNNFLLISLYEYKMDRSRGHQVSFFNHTNLLVHEIINRIQTNHLSLIDVTTQINTDVPIRMEMDVRTIQHLQLPGAK